MKILLTVTLQSLLVASTYLSRRRGRTFPAHPRSASNKKRQASISAARHLWPGFKNTSEVPVTPNINHVPGILTGAELRTWEQFCSWSHNCELYGADLRQLDVSLALTLGLSEAQSWFRSSWSSESYRVSKSDSSSKPVNVFHESGPSYIRTTGQCRIS